jgi:DNA-binding transcriptional ArsR family regulator
MTLPRRQAVVSRPDQMAALASPARQELLDALARMGTASLAELAETLGRPADGLYYHVRALEKVGLVRAAGSRKVGRRSERLVRALAPEYALRYPDAPAARARAAGAIVSGMLRLCIRDYRRAFGRSENRVSDPVRDVWALRTTGWLTPREVADVNRHVRGLRDAVSRSGPRGRLYAVTILLAPLDHRSRPRAVRTPKRKARQ